MTINRIKFSEMSQFNKEVLRDFSTSTTSFTSTLEVNHKLYMITYSHNGTFFVI